MNRDDLPYCGGCGMSHEGASEHCMRGDLVIAEQLIEEFISDVEAAYSDTRPSLDDLQESWFDLHATYIKAKDYVNKRQ